MKEIRSKAQINAEQLRYYQRVLGADIVTRRDNKGLSQKQLVLISGIPQSTVSAIERGDSNATLSSLMGLARGFKTSVVCILRDQAFHQKHC